jgi:hydroxyethylthiazole kinase-like uncharacterized protein yjeF
MTHDHGSPTPPLSLTSDGLPRLPARAMNAHKGTAGTVTVLGGSCHGPTLMIGAPAFTCLGALRAGCGLARVLAPAPIAPSILTICPSATAVALSVDEHGMILASAAAQLLDHALLHSTSLVVGPGLGQSDAAAALTLRCVQQEQCPVVIDADSLTLLARIPELHRDFRARAIITPHPGEFRRLAEALRITADPVNPRTREAAAEQLAQRLGCITVLKGHRTIVTDGVTTYTCTRGHPCLATAGTGDVLAGVIAGLIAQHPPEAYNPFLAMAAAKLGRPAPDSQSLTLRDLASLAVLIHAAAGEAWAAKHGASAGLLAPELAELVPGCVEAVRG